MPNAIEFLLTTPGNKLINLFINIIKLDKINNSLKELCFYRFYYINKQVY